MVPTPPATPASLFLDAAFCRRTPRRPVWMMRQAGRYLPEYQKIRARYDFLTLCKTPAAAAEVSMQPYDILGVDAVIVFSDILLPCEAMGMELVFTDKHGPQFPCPIRTRAHFNAIKIPDVPATLGFVGAAIAATRHRLQNRVPLLGFAGAPWTLACYMIEGGASKNYTSIKSIMYNEPEILEALLQKTTDTIIHYLNLQVAAGAQALQLFDTFGGILSPPDWQRFSLPYIQQIFRALRQQAGVPLILYVRGSSALLDSMMHSGAHVLSIDWMTDLARAHTLAKGRMAIQGNLDPVALFAQPEAIRQATLQMLKTYADTPGYIANLGHGILPDVPVAHAKTFIDTVQHAPLATLTAPVRA